jgi:general secretion pathway protein A
MNDPHLSVKSIGESFAAANLYEGAEDAQNVEQMFLEYYGLNEQPFGVTPDPRFLYLGPKYRDALAALTYGTELNRGFLTLIAQPGMGKTSLLFQHLEHLRNKARVAFLYQTDCDSHDLMRQLLADLDLDGRGKDLPEMRLILNRFLMEEMHAGRRFILVIDEAQNLDEKVLESIRLLSNFETHWMKLMQIVLSGQPQLAERLGKPSMAQLRQRVSFSIRIEPLTGEEVNAYVDHRLCVAGYKGSPLFSTGARALLADQSKGIPRNINNICFCAMSLGWATKAKTIDRELMHDVLADLDPGSLNEKRNFPPRLADEPKRTIPLAFHPPALTVNEAAARGWLANVAVASVVLFALGWVGGLFNLGQRVTFWLHDIVPAVKTSVAPTPVPASLDPPAPASPDGSSPYAKSEKLTDDKSPGVPQEGGVQSTLSSRKSK